MRKVHRVAVGGVVSAGDRRVGHLTGGIPDLKPVPAGLLCSCGRPAVRAWRALVEGVEIAVGWCGVYGLPPHDLCSCSTFGGPHAAAACAQRRAQLAGGGPR